MMMIITVPTLRHSNQLPLPADSLTAGRATGQPIGWLEWHPAQQQAN
jgi:hypothetical protein